MFELYERLRAEGYSPWLDSKNLIPGQNWRDEIPKAIGKSDVVLMCLSQKSVSKRGYLQHELRLALTEYAEKPPGSAYLIPLKLEPCDVPDIQLPQVGVSLRDIQWLDYWEADGFEQLVRALEYQRGSLEHEEAGPAAVSTSNKSPSEIDFDFVRIGTGGLEVNRGKLEHESRPLNEAKLILVGLRCSR